MAAFERQEIEEQLRLSGTIPAELAEIFAEECGEHTSSILDGLDRLCVDRNDSEALADIRTAAHTLKGAAGAVGAPALSKLSQVVEAFAEELLESDVSLNIEQTELLARAAELLHTLQENEFEFQVMAEDLFQWHCEAFHLRSADQGIAKSEIAESAEKTDKVTDSEVVSCGGSCDGGNESFEHRRREEIVAQIQAGQDLNPELQEIYQQEAEEHLRVIYQSLDLLRKDSADREALNALRRSAHTLKGAAGAVGVETVTRLSHRMEDLLDQLAEQSQAPTQEQTQLLLSTADMLQDLTDSQINADIAARTLVELYEQFDLETSTASTASMASTTQGNASSASVASSVELQVDQSKSVFSEQAGNEFQSGIEQTELPSAAKNSVQNQMPNVAADVDLSSTQCAQSSPISADNSYLRVPLKRLDGLVGLVGEMVVNHSAFQQRLSDFEARIEDMQVSIQRLRGVANELETRYSTEALQSNDSSNAHRDDLDSLEFDRYTDFHLLSRSLSEATSDVGVVSAELKTLRGDFDSLLGRQQRFNRDAQGSLIHMRMVPIGSIANRLDRTTRNVSNKIGKQVELRLEGENTELDKTVLEEIIDPLLHLLRNGIDHGIELPEERVAAGKPEIATLRVTALNQGTQVTLRVSDDGRGIDLEKVRTKALERGLISNNKTYSSDELHSLIFTPGFSTANELTDVSGRGVGMDVVRDAIQKLKGTIRVESEPGLGATFTIQLPTTLSVTRALLVDANGLHFAIPMQSVQRIMRLDPDAVSRVGSQNLIRINDESLRLADLSQHMQLRDDEESGFVNPKPMLLLRSGDDAVAMTVDAIEGGRDIVVKTLGDHLHDVPGYIGATVAGDGTVIPILDPADMCGQNASLPKIQTFIGSAENTSRRYTAMVIDDSLSVRRVTGNLLRANGWNVLEAKDGIDAIEKLAAAETPPDVFLCDMEMPRMDGLELVAHVRSQPEFNRTPIAMVTSRAGEKHRKLAAEAGADEHVVKPFKDDELLALISEMVAAHRETALV